VLHVPSRGKTGERGSVPLSTRAREALKRIPRRIDGRVWPYTRADTITQAFRYLLERINREVRERRAAGESTPPEIEDLRLHDLRHEAISRFFENTDLSEMEIAQISGHRDLQTLKRYTHLRAADLADRLG